MSSHPRIRLIVPLILCVIARQCHGLSLSSFSQFHGGSIKSFSQCQPVQRNAGAFRDMTMRKQKASDRRTRRMQSGGDQIVQDLMRENLRQTVTRSPMQSTGEWRQKKQRSQFIKEKSGGRGRSRKRATLYNSLSSYHNKFLQLLTAEYQHEENEVLSRIKSSLDDPIGLEIAGHAMYDLFPQRRGNLFSDEVYRLVKADDATTSFEDYDDDETMQNKRKLLPPNHKVSNNDVIILTLQPNGSGDFFNTNNLPTSSAAVSVEGRVIATGPTYIDIVVGGGQFEAAFGPAPNNIGPSGRGDPRMRLRLDRFFSEVPYTRMVDSLTQVSSIPDRKKSSTSNAETDNSEENQFANISMDEIFKELIISTYAFTDPESQLFHDVDACDLQFLSKQISKPPMPTSVKLANQALTYIQKNPHQLFKPMNGPQLSAVGAALTRKLTMIQGPPGTGKTTVASAIGFGFTHQCRSLSPYAKVLACAFSNVGADNLAEGLLKLGLKVIRIGKPSGVSENLWDYTLDAAINNDPAAQEALENAARATAQLTKIQNKRGSKDSGSMLSEQTVREMATNAVRNSIQACNKAATKALREADVIISTSTGAADPRLLAACGLNVDQDDIKTTSLDSIPSRTEAPDGLPPLSLPFVIVDEACQSVEPATLIPLMASNSCRSMVMLGDPCQLPAVVKSDPSSTLSISLMERLSATLPQPIVSMRGDDSSTDSSFLSSLPTKRAQSLLRSRQKHEPSSVAYKKRFAGSLLLSTQYRMHPSIAAFSSAVFYDGLLMTPALLSNHRPFPNGLRTSMPDNNQNLAVRMINVAGRCNERKGEGGLNDARFASSSVESTTFRNEAEAVCVVNLIKSILRESVESMHSSQKSIGVVTPYTGQVQLIKSMIGGDAEILSLAKKGSMSIEVNSVDGYQGRERDIVILSTVRSNRRGKVGFLSDWRRLNVALTRARNALLIVGDLETLQDGDCHWSSLVKYCHEFGCIFDDSEARK